MSKLREEMDTSERAIEDTTGLCPHKDKLDREIWVWLYILASHYGNPYGIDPILNSAMEEFKKIIRRERKAAVDEQDKKWVKTIGEVFNFDARKIMDEIQKA